MKKTGKFNEFVPSEQPSANKKNFMAESNSEYNLRSSNIGLDSSKVRIAKNFIYGSQPEQEFERSYSREIVNPDNMIKHRIFHKKHSLVRNTGE
jgi:hypothetical protein